MTRPTIVLAAALSLAACVHVSKTVLDNSFKARPVPRDQVNVLMASVGDTLPRACARIAILHGSAPEAYTDHGDMINKLREEAGKLGANTIFIQNLADPGTGERVASALLGTEAERDAESLALFCEA